MAIKFDGNGGNRLGITSGVIDFNSPYTWMGWIYLSVDQNALTTFISITDGTTANRDILRASTTGTLLQSTISLAASNTNGNGTDLAVATWYHVALVRESVTSLKVYLNGVLDSTNTVNITGRAASTTINGGTAHNTTAPLNGRLAVMKAWTVALTLEEVQAEHWDIRPRRTDALYGWWPTFPGSTERARDYSGAGHSWTEVGTLTDEDQPPAGWGTWVPPVVVTAAAAPSATSLPPIAQVRLPQAILAR